MLQNKKQLGSSWKTLDYICCSVLFLYFYSLTGINALKCVKFCLKGEVSCPSLSIKMASLKCSHQCLSHFVLSSFSQDSSIVTAVQTKHISSSTSYGVCSMVLIPLLVPWLSSISLICFTRTSLVKGFIERLQPTHTMQCETAVHHYQRCNTHVS